ncbi:MAG: DUF885 domain-containing protein [Acidimicrobiia bacterium]
MSHTELNDLANEYYEWSLRTHPIEATMRGVHDHDAELDEFSREAEDNQISYLRSVAGRAEGIDDDGLSASDRVTRDVLIFETGTEADATETRMAELAVDPAFGFQAVIAVFVPQLPIETRQQADDFIARFSQLPRAVAEMNDRLAEGLANGRTPMTSAAEKTVAQLDDMLASPVDQSPFMAAQRPPDLDEGEWRSRLADLVRDHIRPALGAYRDMIADQVQPAGRSDEQPGLSWLPDGEASYAAHITRHTSLPMSAGAIHDIGLQQVERLDDEYRELGAAVLGTSDLTEIYARLRDDPDLHFESGPEVVEYSENAMAKAKAAMGDWFGRLPKADCVVSETPVGPLAFYLPPAPDGSRPGTFFINTARPSNWGRFEIEAMAYHESIPGHHLHLAISQELEGIPEFRKYALITVCAEGWGLYAERLADEMGLYTGQLERIGMLSNDSMRSVRLVVDTAIHAMGWSRQKAIDYFLANSPMSLGAIENEVDRYIGNPGQALAYMLGRLEIMRMRSEAKDALGDRFDIKGFHDTVLGSGLVPMPTLDRMVKDWVTTVSG